MGNEVDLAGGGPEAGLLGVRGQERAGKLGAAAVQDEQAVGGGEEEAAAGRVNIHEVEGRAAGVVDGERR